MRFARAFGTTPLQLWEAVHQPPDADLGGGVFKFRLARKGEGRRGGARAIVAMKLGQLAILIYGFEKRDRSNISSEELMEFRKAAKVFFHLSEQQLTQLIAQSTLTEVNPDHSEAEGARS